MCVKLGILCHLPALASSTKALCFRSLARGLLPGAPSILLRGLCHMTLHAEGIAIGVTVHLDVSLIMGGAVSVGIILEGPLRVADLPLTDVVITLPLQQTTFTSPGVVTRAGTDLLDVKYRLRCFPPCC